jgi:hypothetical protein
MELLTKKRKSLVFLFLLVIATLLVAASKTRTRTATRSEFDSLPPVILWAWERPENLEFIDSKQFGVAFLAQTLVLRGDDVKVNLRHQPLIVSPQTKLIAVTRIEAEKATGLRPTMSDRQRNRLTSSVLKTLDLGNVRAIQIDFDVVSSERQFYRSLLNQIRERLPQNVPLSMTALASFCVGDRWLDDLPVDEAIPMIFRMGTDNDKIRDFLAHGYDFKEPLCRKSYGLALDEPLQATLNPIRRMYLFNKQRWTPQDLVRFQERKQQ